MTYEIRLDDFGRAGGSSYSTTIIARYNACEISWGNACHSGKTSSIVMVTLGFLRIVVDETIFGEDAFKKLSALRRCGMRLDKDQRDHGGDRRDAAEAALIAKEYQLACDIEPSVLFDNIVLLTVHCLAGNIQTQHIAGILQAASHEADRVHQQGIRSAKSELRQWLGE